MEAGNRQSVAITLPASNCRLGHHHNIPTSPARNFCNMKTFRELEIDEAELVAMRSKASSELVAMQAELAAINAKCSVRIANAEYKKLQTQRSQIVESLTSKQQEIAALKSAHQKVIAEKTLAKPKNGITGVDVKELVYIRDKWHEFSMDSDNPQKAREVAFKISQEIRAVLKRYFDSKVQE